MNAAPGAAHLPPLILVTDAVRLADPISAVRTLPRGSAVIVRHTDDHARRELALRLLPLAQDFALRLLIANDAGLAMGLGAGGLHLSEANAGEAAHWRARHPDWLITAAAHSADAVARAAAAGAHAALLSPVFPTGSHPERVALGAEAFLAIARDAAIPVYALGGVNAANAETLIGPNIAGIAAIEALIPD